MRHEAHDLGNLLTVSCGYRERAQNGLALALGNLDTARGALEKSQIADARAMQLVTAMLSKQLAAAAGTGTFDLSDVMIELKALLDSEVMLGSNVQLHLQHPGQLLCVAGDALSVFRAILNLCLNARNAMAENGGVITVQVHVDHGGVAVTVSDSGCGIPLTLLAKIWQPHESGDGLHGHGLAIVKAIVDRHGGKTLVMSKPGQGSKFTIWLPLFTGTPDA